MRQLFSNKKSNIIFVRKNCRKWVWLLKWNRMNVSSVENLFYLMLVYWWSLGENKMMHRLGRKRWKMTFSIPGRHFPFLHYKWCTPKNIITEDARSARERSAANNGTKLNYCQKKKNGWKINCGISASVSVWSARDPSIHRHFHLGPKIHTAFFFSFEFYRSHLYLTFDVLASRLSQTAPRHMSTKNFDFFHSVFYFNILLALKCSSRHSIAAS